MMISWSVFLLLSLLTKGQRLSAAGGCDADEVVTRHDDGPHLALDGRWLSTLPGGMQHIGGQASVLKPFIMKMGTIRNKNRLRTISLKIPLEVIITCHHHHTYSIIISTPPIPIWACASTHFTIGLIAEPSTVIHRS